MHPSKCIIWNAAHKISPVMSIDSIVSEVCCKNWPGDNSCHVFARAVVFPYRYNLTSSGSDKDKQCFHLEVVCGGKDLKRDKRGFKKSKYPELTLGTGIASRKKCSFPWYLNPWPFSSRSLSDDQRAFTPLREPRTCGGWFGGGLCRWEQLSFCCDNKWSYCHLG